MAKSKKVKSRWVRRWIVGFAAAMLLVPVLEVVAVRFFDPPRTMPMVIHEMKGVFAKPRTPVLYQWASLKRIPLMFLKHLWISEDQRFFQHHGFDWKEMHIAIKKAEQTGKPVRGVSTITMQCARSLFLWQGRSWIRKGLEAYYTFWMELILSKERIMELYANVIEMGDGIYGIEAASTHYFGIQPQAMTPRQSAMLAAMLPNPTGWDPRDPAPVLLHRQEHILQQEPGVHFPANLLR